MKKILFIIPLFVLVMIVSCKKKEIENTPPIITFKVGNEFTKSGDTVSVGHPLLFGIQARAGNSPITNITVKKRLPNGNFVNMMDTALYADFADINKIFYQNIEERATWYFSVMDRNRLSAEISLQIVKDPNSQFGGIFHFPSIKIGYQNNTQFPQFLSSSTGVVYGVDTAHLFQQNIDILCYYIATGSTPTPAISSPGEMDNSSTEAQTFYPTIVNWTTRNYTLWDISVDTDPIPIEAFDNCHNDSLLIVSYDPIWGKKKFRFATAGKIIPFQTAAGKTGLLKIIHADENESGYMEFELKIQQ